MRIPSIISKVSRELSLRCNLKNQPQKLRTFITQASQPWRRGFTTAISENVKLTSREMIKPSSPTPLCNKSVYLSLIDQMMPPVHNSMVLFYQNDPNNNPLMNTIEQRTKLLKQSLSETLVDFYPLAGRLHRNELIECNDEGVEFCEAHTTENLLDFIKNPNLKDLHAILPFRGEPWRKDMVLSVQVSHFPCGGMALAVCIPHKISDGAAVTDFVKAWATRTRRSDHNALRPTFNGASIFPPLKEFNEMDFTTMEEERTEVRRLIFDKNTIDELKAQAAASQVIRPTTVEAITAFIWKHSPAKFAVVHHSVNLRPRMVGTIPEGAFGNFVWLAITPPMTPVENRELLNRQAITKIDRNFIQDIFFHDNISPQLQLQEVMHEGYDMRDHRLLFTSMSKFPLYEVDFGMGKAIWAYIGPLYKNLVILMGTKCGQGIEAWICMNEDDIAKLDNSLSQHGCVGFVIQNS